MPHLACVHHVVVQQRRRMHELHSRRELDVTVPAVAGELGHREGEDGAQALAAGGDQMIGYFRNQRHLRSRAREDRRIDALHVLGDEVEQRLDRRGRAAFERYDDGQSGCSRERDEGA